MIAAHALPAAIAQLTGAGVPDPARDARKLLAFAMQIDPSRLTLHLQDALTPDAATRFHTALTARANRQPVSQIIGTREFYGRAFRVTPDVLDPRPDTETLIDAALTDPFHSLLDLGTGTGAILLTLMAERPGTVGTGTDISAKALDVAQDNATALRLTPRLILSDWFAALTGTYDLITSNPPYIAADEMPGLAPEVRDWEPHIALTPGGDGLDAYRSIASHAPAHLAAKGRLIVETGPAQGKAVAALFQQAGLQNIRILPDLDGRDRVVCGHKP